MKSRALLLALLLGGAFPAQAQNACPEFIKFLRTVDPRNPPLSTVIPGTSQPISALPATAYVGLREQLYKCLVFGDAEETRRLGLKIDALTEKAREQDRSRSASAALSAQRERQEAEMAKKRAEDERIKAAADANTRYKIEQEKRAALQQQQEVGQRQNNEAVAQENISRQATERQAAVEVQNQRSRERERLIEEHERKSQQQIEKFRALTAKRQKESAERTAHLLEEQREEARRNQERSAAAEKAQKEAEANRDKQFQDGVAKFCPSLLSKASQMEQSQKSHLPNIGLLTKAGDASGACVELQPVIESFKIAQQAIFDCAKSAREAKESLFADELLGRAAAFRQDEVGLAALVKINQCQL